MFSFRWQEKTHSVRRNVVAVSLLAAITISVLPIPISIAPSCKSKDRSQPFPCQDRPCGCRSAEECKRKCCCFTSEQKLAWAKLNGVDASLIVADTKPVSVPKAAKKACCASHSKTKLTRTSRPISKSSNGYTSKRKIVIGIVAQSCHGLALTAFGHAVFLIPPVIQLVSEIESTVERICAPAERMVNAFAEPPTPPPRFPMA